MSGDDIRMRAAQFCEAMQVRGQAKETVIHKRHVLDRFAHWCTERGIVCVVDVTRAVLERYQRYLFNYRTEDDKPLCLATQGTHLTVLRMFFRWLLRQGLILHNPASELDLPKLPKRLPRFVLTVAEVEALMSQPVITERLGLRDRAVLEVLYSTGLRRNELVRLKIHDVDFQRGMVHVCEGKGRKDRMTPIGERALLWLRKYLDEVRPELAREPDDGALFLGRCGNPLCKAKLSAAVRQYVQAAQLNKTGSCHLLRHTAATLMLEHGADIRFIQQMLGHAKLDTTEVYTRVTITKLKEVYEATHPGAKLAAPLAEDA